MALWLPGHPYPKEPESHFARKVDELLGIHGWPLVWHDRATNNRATCRRRRPDGGHCGGPLVCRDCGLEARIVRNDAGFLDRVACRPRDGRLLIAELKSERGRLTPDQRAWVDGLATVRHFASAVWRPSDLDQIERFLR